MLKHCNALQPIANRAALLACLVLSPTTWAMATTSNTHPNATSLQQTTRKTVSGTVTDANGEPLIGVSVRSRDGKGGTITNIDGHFSMQANDGETIEVSYVGYATQTLKVNTTSPMTIVMEEDKKLLNEVVVTALGIKREAKALTYNVQDLKGSEVTRVRDANFVNALAGKIAGVTINQNASGVGGSSRVVMRGTKSLFGENNALYVLDGIPMQGLRTKQSDNFYESVEVADGDGISNINPDDIESMSVLTGASAAALYGNRGANGVILITTKKGTVGRPKVSFSNSTTFSSPFVTPKFQNTYGRKEGEFASWGEKLDNPSNYNPLDFFKTGFNVSNSVALSTGSETSQTHISAGAVNAGGIVPNNRYNRYNFTFRNSWDVVKDVLQLDFTLLYVKQNTKNGIGQGMFYNPLVPLTSSHPATTSIVMPFTKCLTPLEALKHRTGLMETWVLAYKTPSGLLIATSLIPSASVSLLASRLAGTSPRGLIS